MSLSKAKSTRDSLAKAGAVIQRVIESGGSFDPIEGADSGFANQSFDVAAVVFPAKLKAFSDMDAKLPQSENFIISKARLILLSTIDETGDLTPAPELGEILTFQGHDWEVVGFNEIRPQSVPILYQVGVIRV